MEELAHLLAALGCMAIPGAVFWKNPRGRTHRAFLLLGISGLIYNGLALLACFLDGEEARLWSNRSFLGAFLLLPLFVGFPRSYLRIPHTAWTRGVDALAWLGFLALSSLAWRGEFLPPSGSPALAYSSLAAWTLIAGSSFLWGARTLARHLGPHLDQDGVHRLHYLLLGGGVFVVPAFFDLLHRLEISTWQPFPLAPLGSLGFLLCIATAIVRHRLLDIEVVLHRGLVLTLVTPLLGALFVVLGEGLEGLFAGQLPPESPYPNILAALTVAAAFEPLSKLVGKLVETWVVEEFSLAHGLEEFKRLPYLVGARDVQGIRRLQGELTELLRRIEAEAEAPAPSGEEVGAASSSPDPNLNSKGESGGERSRVSPSKSESDDPASPAPSPPDPAP